MENNLDKYIVGICPYLINETCTELPLAHCQCLERTNCTYKKIVDECLDVNIKGSINTILTTKHLTARGELARKILKIMKVGVKE